MTATHFTAWLVNDTSCLDQACMDITILEDQLIGGDPDRDDNWSTDSSKPQAFHAVTTVDAEDGDFEQAEEEARDLMEAAGWRITGSWQSVDVGAIATVEKHDNSAQQEASPRVVTLVSATQGDTVPGVEISDPDCPIDWHNLPADAKAWAEAQGYGADDTELLYVLDAGHGAPEGFPTRTIRL